MTRPSEARINLDNLRHNAEIARLCHGGRQLAVLKANAYGHGAVACAEALRGTSNGFAVAFLDEARALRAAHLKEPILILEGAFDVGEYKDALTLDLWMVVHHAEQIRMLELANLPPARLHVWLKVDSGMHRAGIAAADVRVLHNRLERSGKAASITLMTHFARADEPDSSATSTQLEVFGKATRGFPGARSLCNSAGILAWPSARGDWARPGIMLYGADPMPVRDHGLRPVMSLSSRVFAERWLAPGEPLGYGGGYTADSPTRVGLVAIGYADGYPRTAPTGTPVAVDGNRTRTLGRVSMDMLTVDLTELPTVGLGSLVELWGTAVNVNDVASSAGTLAYEILCNVKRVPLRYVATSTEKAY